MARRRKSDSDQWMKIGIISAVAVVVIAAIVSLFVFTPLAKNTGEFFSNMFSSKENEEEDQHVDYQDVSIDTMGRMTKGTILEFGAAAGSSKPQVVFIGDPENLSRSKKIVNGKPSKLLNAVKDRELTLYVYPRSSAPNRSTAIESVTKAASCRINAESTKSGIFTINGIVRVGDKLNGSENIKTVSSAMGMKKSALCSSSAQTAATSTLNNARHFAEQFQTDKPSLIVGGQLITDVDRLKDNWVELVLAGEPASSLISTDTPK